ncbi:type II toxin-antitoxin system RelE/ParE family toxin [Legionella oakridgensis]|uniref:Plasmid stabilization system protein n=1 Tax=Legionella oakridgensis ATCC 33761 = DSM 21215 TaxID=1268635 RepID=W0BAJ9_9GAMM|nr:type II toxin-antitoxin system RelE/ParE family toxin [Legionella oakridgensis]AHE65647.1 plasmid stabilization system protein [Legionella oakridgensis ATCC 33761 = DSM 21215]
MNPYQFSTQAQKDLIKIRQFTLKHWGAKQSTNYLEKLKNTLQLLSEMPLIGKKLCG